MPPLWRSVQVVILGAIVGGVVVAMVEMVGMRMFPLPGGVDPQNNDSLAAAMKEGKIPTSAMIFVLLAWGAGTFWGAWLAARFAGRAPLTHALVIGVLFLAVAIVNMLMIPHPGWMWIAGVLLFLPAAYLGVQVAGSSSRSTPVIP